MATPRPLPHILFRPSKQRVPEGLAHMSLGSLRKVATFWLGKQKEKPPYHVLESRLRKALEDDDTAARVVAGLSDEDRKVLAVYRRYGGTVNGAVIRIDLLARGLLEKVTNTHYGHTWSRWKRNPIEKLADKWALLHTKHSGYDYYSAGYGQETEKAFPNYSLHAGLAKQIEPAGPAPYSVPPADARPQTTHRRSSAEVALDLSRLLAVVAGRSQIRFNKGGELSTPSLRSLAKALPFDEDKDFPLPAAHGLFLEVLRHTGAVRIAGGVGRADFAAATQLFTKPEAAQAHEWARAWLTAPHWHDGIGVLGSADAFDGEQWDDALSTRRQLLAWALSCLAQDAGNSWYDLTTFVSEFHALLGDLGSSWYGWGANAWDPQLPPAQDKEKKDGEERRRAYWFAGEGAWYANAIMITLVALGLIERGQAGRGQARRLFFRFTPLGRAVFGAPEIAPPSAVEDQRFFVLQPNFDVVAYLDRADAASAGMLGRLTETDGSRSGLVQTFRITRQSLYQAQESGMSPTQIVDFFQRHNQGEVPGNVLRSIADWSAQRESLVLHAGVTLIGFPDSAARDAFLAGNPGTACGEHFIVLPDNTRIKPHLASPLVSDHQVQCRRTLILDEYGQVQSAEPYDILQTARLRRIAQQTPSGWQITADSVRTAAASGMKARMIDGWLHDHLREPIPLLLERAIGAWLGGAPPLDLAEATLLHVADDLQFKAILTSARLRPFLAGSPAPHWLLVRPETRKQLASALEDLGFTVGKKLPELGFALEGAIHPEQPKRPQL